MNNKWSIYISKILGHFWDRIFRDYGFLTGIKRSLGYVGDSIQSTYSSYKKSLNIHALGDTYSRMEYVSIPVSSCIFDYCPITSYTSGDLVGKSDISNTIAIPIEYTHKCLTIQDGLGPDSSLWISGFNMYHNDKYTVLYIDNHNSPKQYPEYREGDIIPMFRLYHTYTTVYNQKNDSFGVLMSLDVSKLSDKSIKSLWTIYNKGPVMSCVTSLISSMTGSDVSDTDGYVVDIWREMGKWCIMDSTQRIYTGISEPVVALQDHIYPGSLLFKGVTIVDCTDKPSADTLPSLFIPSPHGLLKAVNATIHAIPVVVNRTVKYIPDMGNYAWVDAVTTYLKNHPEVTLIEGDECNPLYYIIDNVCPGAITTYVVSGSDIKNPELSESINRVVVTGKSIPGVSVSTIVNSSERTAYLSAILGTVSASITVDNQPTHLTLMSNRVTATII